MSVITFVCAGQMNSAITFPAFENGHEVRLVGSPLDRDIIDGLRRDNFHITLKRTLHDGIKYYQIEELQEALQGADLILGGVSSFGLDWFCDEILSTWRTALWYPIPLFSNSGSLQENISISTPSAAPAPAMNWRTTMTAMWPSAAKTWRP